MEQCVDTFTDECSIVIAMENFLCKECTNWNELWWLTEIEAVLSVIVRFRKWNIGIVRGHGANGVGALRLWKCPVGSHKQQPNHVCGESGLQVVRSAGTQRHVGMLVPPELLPKERWHFVSQSVERPPTATPSVLPSAW